MKRIAKKCLALILCVALCAMAPLPLAVGAEETAEEAVREQLIAAWQALATESKKATFIIADPAATYAEKSTWGPATRKEVTAAPAGFTGDVKELGDYWIEKMPYTSFGWNEICFALRKAPADISRYDSVFFWVAGYDADGNFVSIQAQNQINSEPGSTAWPNTNKAWGKAGIKISVDAAKAVNNIKFMPSRITGNTDEIAYISFGSVVAIGDYTPAMPQNYESLSLEELVAAAQEVDAEGFENTAAFKAALTKAEQEIVLREQLIAAWQALGVTYTEELAVPQEQYTGTDGETYTRQPVTSETVVDGLSNTAVLGSYYVDKLAENKSGWSSPYRINFSLNNGNFNKYTKEIYVYASAYNAEGTPIHAKFCVQVNSDGNTSNWGEGAGWVKVNFKKEYTASSATLVVQSAAEGLAYVSFGSVIGKYTVPALLPENVEALSFRDLVAEAAAYDISACDATADFKAALARAKASLSQEEQERISLIEAWNDLQLWQADQIGALAGGKWPLLTTTSSLRTTDLAALSDEQIAQMGTYVAALEKVSSIGGGSVHIADLTGYEKITWSVYNAGEKEARIDLNLNSYDGDKWLCTWYGINANTFKTMTFDASHAVAKKLFNGEIEVTKPYAQTESKTSWQGKVYFGAPFAWKRVKASLPENIVGLTVEELLEAAVAVDLSLCAEGRAAFETALCALYGRTCPKAAALIEAWSALGEGVLPKTVFAMSDTELYDAAAAVDISLYQNGVEAFEAALIEYCQYVYPERAALIEAWKNLSKKVTEPVAVPHADYAPVAVDASTVVEGLADASVLGSCYVNGYKTEGTFGFNITMPVVAQTLDYDEYFFWHYGKTNGTDSKMKVNFRYDYSQQDLSGWSVAQKGWVKHNVPKANVEAAAAVILNQKAVCFNWEGANELTFGCLMGVKENKKAPMPADPYRASNQELYDAAMALDLTGYANAEAFKEALKAFEAKTATVILPETGNVTVNNALAQEGETVTITVDPAAVKAGSLKVLNAKGEVVAIPTRLHFRNDGNGNAFTFTMPADTVSIQVEAAPADVPNMGTVGWSYHSQTIGIRSIHRVYITNRNGVYYTMIGNAEKQVQDYGVIVGTVENLPTAEKGAKRISFLDYDMRYDVCAEYEELAVTVVGMNGKQQQMSIYSCSYVTIDGETYYSDIIDKTYREVTSATVTGEETIQSVTCLTKQPTALEKVEFEAKLDALTGNVYDDAEVDLTMDLIGPNGQKLSVIGFYYAAYNAKENGNFYDTPQGFSWRFRFSPPVAGEWKYSVTLRLNGEVAEQVEGYQFYVEEATDPKGFLSVEPNNKQTFQFEDGTDFVVIGQNLASAETGNSGYAYFAERMNKMAEGGCNFMRLWLTQWDLALQKAGYAPNDMGGGLQRARTVDAILSLAEELGIYVELCIFHHGMFSVKNDTAWEGTPYNAKFATGYLSEPKEFFSSEQAKADTKDYLRYIVARWGYSPNVMCWQLFNEANITDCEEDEMYQWHEEMCAYLRSIDWQGHMVTTSVAAQDGVTALDCFDYLCGHWYNYEYPVYLCNKQDEKQTKYQRPYLMEEAGSGKLDENLISIHQQNWAGLMGGGAGTAANWYWRECHTIPGYYESFVPVRDFASRIPWSDPNRVHYNSSALTDNQKNVYTVGYGSDSYAYLWVFDNLFNNTYRNETTFSDYQVTVPLANGTYNVTWINPWNGNTVQSTTITVTNGSAVLKAPTFTRDLAVVVEAQG